MVQVILVLCPMWQVGVALERQGQCSVHRVPMKQVEAAPASQAPSCGRHAEVAQTRLAPCPMLQGEVAQESRTEVLWV